MENSEEKNLDVKDTMQDKAYKVIKKCKEIAEKDFTKFSALFVAVMTVGLKKFGYMTSEMTCHHLERQIL